MLNRPILTVIKLLLHEDLGCRNSEQRGAYCKYSAHRKYPIGSICVAVVARKMIAKLRRHVSQKYFVFVWSHRLISPHRPPLLPEIFQADTGTKVGSSFARTSCATAGALNGNRNHQIRKRRATIHYDQPLKWCSGRSILAGGNIDFFQNQ